MNDASDLAPRPVLVDAHVHVYAGFDTARFFNSALANIRAGGRELGLTSEPLGCLLFSETADDHFFLRLAGGEAGAVGWTFEPAGEDRALLARREDGATLLLGAGRQIRAVEDLEVLALGTMHEFGRQHRFIEAFETALATAGVVVLPWGFGMWWFRRGTMVREVLERYEGRRFFLGDNGGRLAGSRRPALFAEAERRGHWVLPGSDPLPLPGEEQRAGSYGFLIETVVDARRPLTAVLSAVCASPAAPPTYGSRTPFPRFCMAQLRLQARKRLRPR